MLGAPLPPAARRIATAEIVGGGVTMAVTRLVVTVVGVPPAPTKSTVATLSIAVPAGVTVCARAGSDISNRPASATARKARKPRTHRYTEGGTAIRRPARVVYHSL